MSTQERHVFVSYSRADAAWLERLQIHLRPLVRSAGLDIWDDSKILPGQRWREEITQALDRARVAILMISADFLASEFIIQNELPVLLHRAANAGLLVLPLIVGPCRFEEHEQLSRYQCINNLRRPLSAMSPSEAEAVLVSLGRSIEQYFRRSSGTLARPGLPPLVVERPINLSFDGPVIDGIPMGWFNSFGYVSGVSTDYEIRMLPRSEDRSEGACVYLEKLSPLPGEFGSLMQRCPCDHIAGRTVRIEAELRAQAVAGWAGLWLRADGQTAANMFFDNMSARPLLGTTTWTRYFIDAPLPVNARWLNYGIVLSEAGRLYADNIRILVWSAHGAWMEV